LERPLIKEASISYVLRKAAELKIDLRKEFINADSLQLNVIPRLKFCNILMTLPFGLSQIEIDEILDSDLAFDNCGNVDYEKIVETELFLELERKMIL
jgi:Ca2+-binding EF-hand superfamily protein